MFAETDPEIFIKAPEISRAGSGNPASLTYSSHILKPNWPWLDTMRWRRIRCKQNPSPGALSSRKRQPMLHSAQVIPHSYSGLRMWPRTCLYGYPTHWLCLLLIYLWQDRYLNHHQYRAGKKMFTEGCQRTTQTTDPLPDVNSLAHVASRAWAESVSRGKERFVLPNERKRSSKYHVVGSQDGEPLRA